VDDMLLEREREASSARARRNNPATKTAMTEHDSSFYSSSTMNLVKAFEERGVTPHVKQSEATSTHDITIV